MMLPKVFLKCMADFNSTGFKKLVMIFGRRGALSEFSQQ